MGEGSAVETYTGRMTASMRSGYSLGAPTRVCAGTGAALNTGDAFVAVLAQEPGSEEFVRLDYSPGAWEAAERPVRTPDGRRVIVLGIWRGRVPEPGARPRVWVDDASLIEMFEQSVEESARSGAEEARAFVFVLALVLARKRLLVIESSRPGRMLVRFRGSEAGSIEVVDPGLSEEVMGRVAEMLEGVMTGGVSQGEGGGVGGGS